MLSFSCSAHKLNHLAYFCIIAVNVVRKLDGTGAVEGQAIVMRLMSNSFRISTSATSRTNSTSTGGGSGTGALQVRMVEAIKVAFRTGEVLDVISGAEPRVPVQYHEFSQVQ